MSKKVFSKLLQQNVYLSDTRQAEDLAAATPQYDYVSIDEVTVANGIQIRETVNSYDITPETVNSYVDSCDYRTDMYAATQQPARGQNLGDVASLQNVMNMDLEQAKTLYAQLEQRFAASKKKKTVSSAAAEPVNDDGGTSNGK
ncbi:hypothetical protein [Dipodfec virus RodF1_43]|uniref:Uncharacterized protein n=1 Tax=Dipodfec virus RodF1_43 TaxID=2929297 RepID=A0A976R7Y0_9VIRU|nr:hypothetical protein [Dipodfec virus RodF1_43]